MIRWNGKNWIPAGVKPVIGRRRGAPVPGRPKARWVAGWVGGLGEPADPFACDFTFSPIFPPSPTPTSTVTPTPSITPSVTVTPTPSPSVIPFDPDAAAFLESVVATGGTVDATMSAATNTFYTELKSEGLYSKMILFYPFIGGTAASHSIMGIRSSGTTYDLTMVGGMTHGVSGSTGNGTNSGMNTKYDSSNLPFDRTMGIYLVDGLDSETQYNSGGGTGNDNVIIVSYQGGSGFFGFGSHITYSPTLVGNKRQGNLIGTITGTSVNAWKNGTQVITNGTATNDRDSRYLSLLSDNRQNPPSFNPSPTSSSTMAFALYSEYLTNSEATTLSTLINNYQTSLGRNIY